MPKSRKHMKLKPCPDCGEDELRYDPGEPQTEWEPAEVAAIWCEECEWNTTNPYQIDSLWEPDYDSIPEYD